MEGSAAKRKRGFTAACRVVAAEGAHAEPAQAGPALVDAADFEALRQGMATYDASREGVIKKTRDVQKLAKQAIFSLHRGDDTGADAKLQTCEELARALLPDIEREPMLRPGSYAAAMEEYAEAVVFRTFLREGRLLPSRELPLATRDEYLGGVLDFTGELNRWAVARATARDFDDVRKAAQLVEAIFGQMLQFDLRNTSLRKKYDSLKYCLNKLEGLLYEASLSDNYRRMHEVVGDPTPNVGAAAAGATDDV